MNVKLWSKQHEFAETRLAQYAIARISLQSRINNSSDTRVMLAHIATLALWQFQWS